MISIALPTMPVLGETPDHGFRLTLERSSHEGPPWTYSGDVRWAGGGLAVGARVDVDGGVEVTLGPRLSLESSSSEAPAPDDAMIASLNERVRQLVRAATKPARPELEGATLPPPRRIVRWRGEKGSRL